MASVYHLFDDAVHTEGDIVTKYASQQHVCMRIYFAAGHIQKTFRGYTTRKIIKRWHEAATKIQKMVRGWLVRYQLPDIMHEYYDQMCSDRYSNSATKIQALWKGYSERKQLCFGDIFQQREDIAASNERIITAFREQMAQRHEMFDLEVAIKIMTVLFDRHHLLRIHQKEGVFSNHDSRELSQLEKILKSTKWRDYMDKLRKYYNRFSKKKIEQQYMFNDKKLRKLEDLLRQRDTTRDVRLDPDLGPDRYSRGNEMKMKIDPKPYERWLMATGKFTLPITEVVRTEEKEKHISKKDFDLHVLKMFAKEADVPPYYLDFWFEQCKIHNF